MIRKILCVALLGFALVRSNPLLRRGKRSPPVPGPSSIYYGEKPIAKYPLVTSAKAFPGLNADVAFCFIWFVLVAEYEGAEPSVLPLEPDGTLSLTTLKSQFFGACGLQFRDPESGKLLTVRFAVDRFHPPSFSWGSATYLCVFSKEGESDANLGNAVAETTRTKKTLPCVDLVVLGVRTSSEVMRAYFEQFGEVDNADVMRDVSGKSRGFGFVRFRTYDSQRKCLSSSHIIHGRLCGVRISQKKNREGCQLYVGGFVEPLTKDDLYEYFSNFGQVMDVYVPLKCQRVAFVVFHRPTEIHSVLYSGDRHDIKGVRVSVAKAATIEESRQCRMRKMGSWTEDPSVSYGR